MLRCPRRSPRRRGNSLARLGGRPRRASRPRGDRGATSHITLGVGGEHGQVGESKYGPQVDREHGADHADNPGFRAVDHPGRGQQQVHREVRIELGWRRWRELEESYSPWRADGSPPRRDGDGANSQTASRTARSHRTWQRHGGGPVGGELERSGAPESRGRPSLGRHAERPGIAWRPVQTDFIVPTHSAQVSIRRQNSSRVPAKLCM